jgi:hypothetical protein
MSKVETTTTRRGSIRSRSLISAPIIIISSCHAAFGVANLGPASPPYHHVTLAMVGSSFLAIAEHNLCGRLRLFFWIIYMWRAEAANADAVAGSLAKLLPLASAATIFLGAFPANQPVSQCFRLVAWPTHRPLSLITLDPLTIIPIHVQGQDICIFTKNITKLQNMVEINACL